MFFAMSAQPKIWPVAPDSPFQGDDRDETILPPHVGDRLCPLPLDAVGFVDKLWKKNDLFVYFLTRHENEDAIIAWANEWSKYCAIIFHQTLKQSTSDIRVAFNDGM